MLSRLRRLVRPVGILLLMVSVTPVQAFPCAEAVTGDVMPCCVETGGHTATLEGECCALREAPQEPERGPALVSTSTKAAGAPAADAIAADALTLPPAERSALPAGADTGPPHARLYLRLSNIRR